MRGMLALAAVGEAATGVALLIVPALVVQWLFGAELAGVGITLARVAGIALIGLGVSCWPGPPALGMLTYGAGAALYLAYLGFSGASGVLLWPAVVLHLILSALLVRGLLGRKPVPQDPKPPKEPI